MLVHKRPGEEQSRVPFGILSGRVYGEAITLWDCEGSMEPSRLGWDCGSSSHLALKNSCDDTEALHYLPLQKVVLDPVSSYLQYRSHSKKKSPSPSAFQLFLAVSITKWSKVLMQDLLHWLHPSHVLSVSGGIRRGNVCLHEGCFFPLLLHRTALD